MRAMRAPLRTIHVPFSGIKTTSSAELDSHKMWGLANAIVPAWSR